MAHYLIIAPSKFHNDLEGLRELRAGDHRVQMVDPARIYATAPKGSSREEAIQRFVGDIYRRTDGGLKYLLLVGDDTPADLPEEIPVGKYNGDILSDAFYGDIDGDRIPEIAVGRLPAVDSKGVRDFVAKVVEYETGSQTRALQNRLSFYAGVAGFGPVEDLLLEAFVYALMQRRVPRSYQLDIHYDADGSVFNTGRTFAKMLDEGAFALTYMGHGSPNLLATEPPFGADDLGNIAIENGLPLLNLMACSAGCFANNDCLGEQLTLLRRGPVTVIGSSETISPPVLQFFGDRMAEYLEKNGETTIGDVFLHAQRNLVDEKDFLWRIFEGLPPWLTERAGLSGEIREGVLRQGLQMSLMGDPALTWRVSQGSEEEIKNDARLKGPQTGRMRERISLSPPQGEGRDEGGLSTKTLYYDDLETVLSLVDYLLYRVPDLVGRDKVLLPKPGSVTIDHGLVRVPFDEPVTVSSQKLPPYLKQLFFPSGMGALRFEKQLSFSAAFQNGVVALEDIAGITLLPDNNERRSLLGLKIDLTKEEPKFEAQFGLPPVSEAEALVENTRLEKLFEGQSVKVQLEWDATFQTAEYVLMRKPPENRGFVRERKLFRVDANHLPTVLEGRGILLTLPYGNRIGYNSENSDLVLNEAPAGEKTQSYLLVPFATGENQAPPHDPDDAIRTEIYEKLRLKDRPTADTAGGTYYQWPLYGFYVHKEPPTFQNVSFGTASWSKGPLFERKPEDPKTSSATQEESEKENPPEEDSSFSWSGLNRTGAEVCLVLDGSGSMGRPIETIWETLREKVEEVPGLIRSFIKGAMVAVEKGGVTELAGLTRMTPSGVEKFDHAIREFSFQGEEGNLQAGIEACRKIVKPNPDGSVFRGIFVLSDSEGLASQPVQEGFGIFVAAIDKVFELPKMGNILKLKDTTAIQKYLTSVLTRSLVPRLRAEKIAETMAPYAPTLREDEKTVWEMAVGYTAQQRSSQERVDFFQQYLSYGAVAEKSERVTEMIVAAAGLLPMEEFNALMPQIDYLENLPSDGPLKEAVKKAKQNAATSFLAEVPSGKFRDLTDLERDLAKRYYQETIRDPEAVPLNNLEKLLAPGSIAVDALVHIVKYGTRERQLEALRILTENTAICTATINKASLYNAIDDLGDVDPYLRKPIRNFGIRLGIITGVEEEK